MTYRTGDVVLVRGSGFLSRAIRFFTRSVGESRTSVNHVGVIVSDGSDPVIVEALRTVQAARLSVAYPPNPKEWVAVYRPTNIPEADLIRIGDFARAQIGKSYGYLKLVLHALDWALLGAYVFRRLGRMENYPICSWLVAHAYASAGYDFGVDDDAASPDDIWDFVTSHGDKYACVRELSCR